MRWSTTGDALIYFRTGRAREDELVRREVDGDGALSDQAEVIMPRTPTLYNGEFDVARRSGAVVIGTGDALTDLWSFEIDRRPVASTPGDPRARPGTVSPWSRSMAGTCTTTAVMPSGTTSTGSTGSPVPRRPSPPSAGRVRTTMMLSVDGTRLAYARVSDAGQLLQEMDVTTRRVSSTLAPIGGVSLR